MALNTVHRAKLGNLWPPLRIYLKDNNSKPVWLGKALSAALRIQLGTDPTSTYTAVIKDKSSGFVEYQWVGGELPVAGTYKGWIDIMWPGNLPQTFPTTGNFTIEVEP